MSSRYTYKIRKNGVCIFLDKRKLVARLNFDECDELRVFLEDNVPVADDEGSQ